MDASPVQSGSKCGSDFSIERILRSDSSSGSVAAPEWLCCTRYRPPRLPRAVSGGACRGRRAGRHARVPFTAAQAAALEAAYARAPYLAPPALRALAAALQLRDDRIKIWFQNRRARERREKCANIAPPLAITLPPTNASGSFTSHQSNPGLRLDSVQSISEYTTSINQNLDRSMFEHEANSSSESFTDRPDTPLDIETIDD